MQMTYDEALMRYNLLSNLLYKDGDDNLNKELKIKLIKMKIEFSKINKEFEDYQSQCVESIKTDEFEELQNKQDRTEEENKRLNEIIEGLNNDLNQLLFEKSRETTEVKFDYLTEEEFDEILLVNANNENVTINGNKIDSGNFLDLFHTLFIR